MFRIEESNWQEYLKIIEECSRYATLAHRGQFRADGKTPYIVHPARVYALVSNSRYISRELGAIAWLHDVVEDCLVSIETDFPPNGKLSSKRLIKNMEDNAQFKYFEDFLLGNYIFDKSIGLGKDILDGVLMLSHDEKIKDKSQKRLDSYKRLYSEATSGICIVKACDRIDNLSSMKNCFSIDKQKWYIEDTHLLLGYIGKKVENADENIAKLLYNTLREAELNLGK